MLIVGKYAPGRALTISARPTMAGASHRSGLIGRAALDSTRMSTEGRLRGLQSVAGINKTGIWSHAVVC